MEHTKRYYNVKGVKESKIAKYEKVNKVVLYGYNPETDTFQVVNRNVYESGAVNPNGDWNSVRDFDEKLPGDFEVSANLFR